MDAHKCRHYRQRRTAYLPCPVNGDLPGSPHLFPSRRQTRKTGTISSGKRVRRPGHYVFAQTGKVTDWSPHEESNPPSRHHIVGNATWYTDRLGFLFVVLWVVLTYIRQVSGVRIGVSAQIGGFSRRGHSCLPLLLQKQACDA